MDEQVPNSVINGLRLRGVDVLTTKEADLLGGADKEHLSFASRQGRILFTHDADFLRLHAQGVEHHGIVYAHQRAPVGNIIRGLMLINQVLEPDDMKNHLEFL